MSNNESPKDTLQLLLPTTVSLIGIGLLTLATPLVTELSQSELLIDVVVGVMMVGCGIACGMYGRLKS